MASRKESKKQKDKISQALIKAGLKLSAETGYASLSLRSVAREAGIAPTSFYRHFREIDEMGVEIVAQAKTVLSDWLTQARKKMTFPVNKKTGSPAGLEKAIEGITRPFVETFMTTAGKNQQLIHLFFQEKTGSSEELRDAIADALEQLTRDLTETLDHLSKTAQRPLGDVPLIAKAMLTIVSSIGMEMLVRPEIKPGAASTRAIRKLNLLLLGAVIQEQHKQGNAHD